MKNLLLAALTISLILSIIGCNSKSQEAKAQTSQKQPEEPKTSKHQSDIVKLKDIMDNPKVYKNKEVVLEGNFGGICCASDFFYKEGVDSCEVYPKGIQAPKAAIGTPIRLKGTVKATQKGEEYQVHIEATEVTLK